MTMEAQSKTQKKLPLIKFCGIQTVEDLLCAADCNIDYCGLMFYKKSPRYLSIQKAEAILETARSKRVRELPKIVGVFVDADSDEIQDAADLLSLDCLQLYAPYKYCDSSTIPYWSVLRVQDRAQLNDLQALARVRQKTDFEPGGGSGGRSSHEPGGGSSHEPGYRPDESLFRRLEEGFAVSSRQLLGSSGFLLDAHTKIRKGGTGTRFDWSWLENLDMGLPCFIAGGIDRSTVTDLLRYRPYGIDISSGIEEELGKKSHVRMRELADIIQRFNS